MGSGELKKPPVCPDGFAQGSEEYSNWYLSLPEEGQALLFTKATENDIKYFETLPSIDTKRAIRGLIVGNIAGDGTGGLHGSCILAMCESAKKDVIVSGLKLTWLEAIITVEKLGHFLPDECRQAYADLFEKFSPFVEKALNSSSPYSHEEFLQQGWDLYLSLHAISNNPPGMEKSDTKYALDILHYKFFNTDQANVKVV